MHALAASQILDVCERGRTLAPVHRAVLLLGAASPEWAAAEISAFPIGVRNSHLLMLREQMFGPTLEIDLHCPACQERLELSLAVADVLDAAPPGAGPSPLDLQIDGYHVSVRLPTSDDVASESSPEGLMARCLIAAHGPDDTSAADLPQEVSRAAMAAMGEADPLADVELSMSCPACEHAWAESLDPAAFVWAELEATVPRVVRDVHRLASAYGWPERDVLAMSAWRRAQYLGLLGV